MNGPRDPTETVTEMCLSVCCGGRVSSGLPQGQGLWVRQTWVWHKPSWRRSPLTPLPELKQDWELDSWKTQTEPHMHQDPGERSSDPQETDPDLPRSVQGSPAEAWIGGGLLQGWGHWGSSAYMGPFEGGHHFLHYLHHSLGPGK